MRWVIDRVAGTYLDEEQVDRLRSHGHPIVEIDIDEDVDTPEPGASRLFGSPDLPADLDWPHSGGTPLPFLAQFDLAALREHTDRLPPTGSLVFFGDPEREVGCVLHVEGPLSRREDVPAELEDAEPVGLVFSSAHLLPGSESEAAQALEPDDLAAYREAETDAVVEFMPLQLFGVPTAFTRSLPMRDDHVLLFELVTDEGEIPDEILLFTIPEEALSAGRFAEAVMTVAFD